MRAQHRKSCAGRNPCTASYNLKGTCDLVTGKFSLNPVNWDPPVPNGFAMVGVDGSFNDDVTQVFGRITGGSGACSTFQAAFDQAESSALVTNLHQQQR